MTVRVRYFTDPACPWSWAIEPTVRRLMVEFGEELEWTYVMGGLARDYAAGVDASLLAHWLDVADESGMPIDPRLWTEGPIRSTYPSCLAVKAAAEQADDAGYRYLRALREGLFCFRRKLDTAEALVEEARRVGLDVSRFRIDLESNAVVEAFGADLEAVRRVPDEARAQGEVKGSAAGDRLTFPSMEFSGGDGGPRGVYGVRSYDDYRRAAVAAGAEPASGRVPGVLDALDRFGRMATAEVAAVCDLPGPRAAAELWSLASEWRLRPVRVLTGELWEVA